ncbi:HNH endonuclease [Terracoccus sp. 273MFTsu3.1]|uniref:HNH endonuclease n=1 Tax=Terracoccus sp. 273MFTsu3.1 TaxID=1172188 RepID=UPI0003790A59|nr:HNH endonuclease [Terracoccus sp. 273MFTsu3.1]
MARFDWTYDEVVLAASLVAQNAWQGLRATNPKVVELSDLLRDARIHPTAGRPDNFRSPSSVQRKTFDIATQHPEYSRKKTRGGPHDAEVLLEFISEPLRMVALAAAIRDEIAAPPDDVAPADDADLDELTAHEGRTFAVTHLRRERNPKLRAAKLVAVTAKGLPIACEVCGFNFAVQYGDPGKGYIEVHHVLPLHASGPVLTRLDDLALLCSNCHRMIHRARPWLTPADLKELMERRR